MKYSISRKGQFPIFIAFLLLGLSFFLLNIQSVPVGDDLGYMFTDSVHHLGDGHRVHTLKDITTTIACHYFTTNGRFIVHWFAMFFLNIGGHVLFTLVNTIFFLIALFYFYRLSLFDNTDSSDTETVFSGSSVSSSSSTPASSSSADLILRTKNHKSRTEDFRIGTLLSLAILLWIAVPFPGTTWLGLVCYSTNYLWTAAISLLFLWFIVNQKVESYNSDQEHHSALESQKSETNGQQNDVALRQRKTKGIIKLTLLSIGCVIAGSLQESFSLPVSGGLFILWVVNRKRFGLKMIMATLSYWVGTAICAFAPGNMAHASQGGGFTIEAITAKSGALVKALLTECPVSLVFVVLFICYAILKRKSLRQFLYENLLIISIVIFSLLFALITFTAARQLTFPMILLGILCVRIIQNLCGYTETENRLRRFGNTWGLIIYIGTFIAIWSMRHTTQQIFQDLHDQAKTGRSYVVFDKTKLTGNVFYYMLKQFDYSQLPVMFDGYTKRGLSRLYDGRERTDVIKHVLPVPIAQIVTGSTESKIEPGRIYTAPLCPGYRCFRLSRSQEIKGIRDANNHHPPVETIQIDTAFYIIVPETKYTHILTYRQ